MKVYPTKYETFKADLNSPADKPAPERVAAEQLAPNLQAVKNEYGKATTKARLYLEQAGFELKGWMYDYKEDMKRFAYADKYTPEGVLKIGWAPSRSLLELQLRVAGNGVPREIYEINNVWAKRGNEAEPGEEI